MNDETDEELWRWAALAAGVSIPFSGYFPKESKFNPLNDNGDSIRLAIQLGLQIWFTPYVKNGNCTVIKSNPIDVIMNGGEIFRAFEPYQKDPQAAMRRAIVRAAAYIGQSMRDKEVGGKT